ncbi:TPA_asm: hypothetical protein GIO55_14220 [Listeria monocytogenes]|nr:hypothetical protein [Listeria monocytogenes]
MKRKKRKNGIFFQSRSFRLVVKMVTIILAFLYLSSLITSIDLALKSPEDNVKLLKVVAVAIQFFCFIALGFYLVGRSKGKYLAERQTSDQKIYIEGSNKQIMTRKDRLTPGRNLIAWKDVKEEGYPEITRRKFYELQYGEFGVYLVDDIGVLYYWNEIELMELNGLNFGKYFGEEKQKESSEELEL